MKAGSLFSGVDGLDAAVRAFFDAETAWFVEKLPERRAVLESLHPGVPIYPDVAELDFTQVESVDVLCGGFPCQDISGAGKRAGIKDGTRSGLWSHFARAIRDLRPAYVVVENVRDLLAIDNGAGFGRVLGDLAEAGFDAEWCCLPASAVGAPHRRERVFLLAWLAAADSGWQRDERRGDAGIMGDAARERERERQEPKRQRVRDAARHRSTTARDPARDSGGGLNGEPTKALPTPTVGDAKNTRNRTATRNRIPPTGIHDGLTLLDVVTERERESCQRQEVLTLTGPEPTDQEDSTSARLLPTPTARDHKGPSGRKDNSDLPRSIGEITKARSKGGK